MRASSAGVGSRSSSPSTYTRTLVAPTKEATFSEMPRRTSESRNPPSVVQSIGVLDVALVLEDVSLHRVVERAAGLALAHDLERDPLLEVAHAAAVRDQGLVGPRQHVDETRRDGLAARVDLGRRPGAGEVTDRGDAIATNADVRAPTRRAGAIVERAVADDEVVSVDSPGRASLRPGWVEVSLRNLRALPRRRGRTRSKSDAWCSQEFPGSGRQKRTVAGGPQGEFRLQSRRRGRPAREHRARGRWPRSARRGSACRSGTPVTPFCCRRLTCSIAQLAAISRRVSGSSSSPSKRCTSQSGTLVPQRLANFSMCGKRVIGRMPGTISASMPAAAHWSRKRRKMSVSKKNCVIARLAPASIFARRLSRSNFALGASGCTSGYAATEMSKLPTLCNPRTRSTAYAKPSGCGRYVVWPGGMSPRSATRWRTPMSQ